MQTISFTIAGIYYNITVASAEEATACLSEIGQCIDDGNHWHNITDTGQVLVPHAVLAQTVFTVAPSHAPIPSRPRTL